MIMINNLLGLPWDICISSLVISKILSILKILKSLIRNISNNYFLQNLRYWRLYSRPYVSPQSRGRGHCLRWGYQGSNVYYYFIIVFSTSCIHKISKCSRVILVIKNCFRVCQYTSTMMPFHPWSTQVLKLAGLESLRKISKKRWGFYASFIIMLNSIYLACLARKKFWNHI